MEMTNTYMNPVPFTDGKRRTKPDPFVIRWCGNYYCYATDARGITVCMSKDLTLWQDLGYALTDEGFRDYWAPSVMYQNGTFYMYYSNLTADEPDGHQQYLKLAVSRHPEGPFEYQKTFFDKFSIDSHPVWWNGELNMFYSVNDWIGTDDQAAGTCIIVDQMKTTEEFAGQPKAAVLPSLPQEIYEKNRFADGRDWYTIEGACTVVHGGTSWLLYSANAYEHEDYFVGYAVAENKDQFTDMDWQKYPSREKWQPLLIKNQWVSGTGHNTVVKAPDLVHDWIVYHGRRTSEPLLKGTEQREMYIDQLYYNGRKLLCRCLGQEGKDKPQSPSVVVNHEICRDTFLTEESYTCYRTELWLSGTKNHTGIRWGCYLAYQDEENYLELQFSSGTKTLKVIRCCDCVQTIVAKTHVNSDFDYTVPHCLLLERCFDYYRVIMDDLCLFEICIGQPDQKGRVGIRPYFSEIMLHSLTLTVHVQLQKQSLQWLTKFYKLPEAFIEQDVLHFRQEVVTLTGKIRATSYEEEFLLETEGGEVICGEGTQAAVLAVPPGRITLYHLVRNGQSCYEYDGDQIWCQAAGTDRLTFKGITVREYRFTSREAAAKN